MDKDAVVLRGPCLHNNTAQIHSWDIPLTPQMSLGAKKVATADGYIDSFLWNSGKQLYGMSEAKLQLSLLWS